MNIVRGIFLKVVTTLIFTVMGALARLASQTYPLGEVVFYRGACAIIPVVVVYAWRRELWSAVRMDRPIDHFGRGVTAAAGMYLGFASLTLLPLVDAIAIGFTAPLITVALAVIILGERVRMYRWSAVGIGFVGVIVMLLPHVDFARLSAPSAAAGSALGVSVGLLAAVANAGTVIQTRRMTGRETTSAIVFYFSVFMALGGLVTLPFGWNAPDAWGYALLVSIGILGGLGHILLTESFRFAPASVIAPFDYTAMLWALVLGYAVFGEVPSFLVLVGAAIVVGAGLFVLLRERQLGLQRAREAEGSPTGT